MAKVRQAHLRTLSIMSKADRERITVRYWMSLTKLTTGLGTEYDLYVLLLVCELVYIALQSGEFVDTEVPTGKVEAAAVGVRLAAERVESGGSCGLNGDTIQGVRYVLQVFEYLQETTRAKELRPWYEEQYKSQKRGSFLCLRTAAAA